MPVVEKNGATILIRIETAPGSGAFTTIAAQRNSTITETNSPVDFSSKDSRFYKGVAGRYSATIALEHLYIPTSSGYLSLRTAARAGTNLKIRKSEDGVDTQEASCFITSLAEADPDQAPVVVSCNLQVSEQWTSLP